MTDMLKLREKRITFRVNAEEFAAITRAARKDRRPVGDFIREALMVDLMLELDHTFMSEVRRKMRQSIEDKTFQEELPIVTKKRA